MAVLTDTWTQRKRLLWVLLAVLVIVLLVFLWWHWRQFNGRTVSLGDLYATYSTTAQDVVLRIDADGAELTRDGAKVTLEIGRYRDNVLELGGYLFVIVDDTTIYAGDFSKYLYRV